LGGYGGFTQREEDNFIGKKPRSKRVQKKFYERIEFFDLTKKNLKQSKQFKSYCLFLLGDIPKDFYSEKVGD